MIETGRHQEETPRSTYPLTALQQGMLFHHLLEPNSGVDIEQLVLSLPEAIDEALLRRAWQFAAARHDVLRTSFRWNEADRPVQEVWSSAEIPFRSEDWRGLDPAQVQERFENELRDDRRLGFAMDRAPLLRLGLFRVGERAYELLWTFHHAVLDGRSFGIVLGDVFACYEALERGDEPDTAAVSASFADHVAWLQQHVAPAEEYWRERLRGLDAPTPLPAGFPDAASVAQRHGERFLTLSIATTAALERFARDNDVTLNTVLQGAWALLLARHSGETEVVFGGTRAGRRSTIANAGDVAGLFINTLPVRASVVPDRPLGAWLRELRRDWTAMRPYEQTPLPQVQRWSEMPSGTPLFESIVVFENRLLESALRAFGGRWERRRVRLFEQTNFPLTVAVYGDVELTVKLQFDGTRHDGATIERLLGQLEALLTGIAESSPDRPIGDLPWLSDSERRLVVETWNATRTEYPRDAAIANVFAARAAAHPDAVALVHESQSLTYRELDERANRLAHRLQRLGVGRDVPAGVCATRSIEAVVAVLGILKAGGAYVPLDPGYPAERLAFMARDTQLGVAVSTAALAGALPPLQHVVLLDADAASLAAEPALAPVCPADAQSLAYIIYTSGSTGVPKGVTATQRGVVRLVCGARYARFGADDVVLGFAPLTFDASTFEIWGPLLNGGRLALFGNEAPTLEDLGEALLRYGITTLWLTAALFHQMVDRNIGALRGLRQLLAGGDVLSVPHVRRALAELPNCTLVNGYGPTENTTFTTCYPVPRDWNADGRAGSLPIGAPIQNTTVYVLDAGLRPVPIGVAGRLYTGGDGVARGYHDRPELTAERFLSDPFAERAGARMYDTGDRVRWRPGGMIEFLGRADQQLKIRGFRVEPGEIEAVLMQHADVLDAVVVGRDDGGTKRLIGYAVPRPGRSLDGEALRAFLGARLPAYLVPMVILPLDTFPVTSNGKLDRARLPDPDTAIVARQTAYEAPRDATEAALAQIWTTVLGVDRVGVTDNFFELGGDSILTIALISRARDAGLRVTPRQLYDFPTIAQLASAALPLAGSARDRGAVTGAAPLTPIQRWFFESETEELDYWNQSFLFSAAAPLDDGALRTALRDLIAHHDALRLRFDRSAAGWTQRFAEPDADVPLESVDLSAVPDAALERAVEDVCVRAQRSLDIARGPLLRALHFTLGARGERLLLAVHHLAVDGVSWRVLLEDLVAAYDAARSGRASALPPRTTSFKEWAERLAESARAGAFDDQREYWREIAVTPSPRLPRDVADGPRDDVEGASDTVTVALSPEETRTLLQRVPAAYTTRINDVLVTALARALRRWVGTGSLLVNLEGHGREDLFDGVDLSRTVGWFTTLFPIRLALSDAPPLDQLRAIKEQMRSIPQRGLAYGALRYLGQDPVLASAPPAEIVFNYLGQFDRSVDDAALFDFAPEPYGAWRGPRAHRPHPVEVNGLVIDGRLELRWSYGRGMHTAETIARVAADFLTALRELIALCTAAGAGGYTPSDFPLARLDQGALDAATGALRDVADLYPLTPIQRLFHVFADPLDDPGFEQWRYRVHGRIDVPALRAAWQTVLDRHAILRTAFVSEGLAEPLQLVRRKVELSWDEHDLRALTDDAREREIERILHQDRARGFDFERAPLMRLTVLHTAGDRCELIWSQHHLLTDRWSWPIVLREVQTLYERSQGRSIADLEPPVPYRAYIDWLARRDLGAAESFWRRLLDGYTPPPAFTAPADIDADVAGSAEVRLDLDAAETAALHAFVRAEKIPLNTAITAAWALWLAHHTAASDVLLGLSVSGRPDDLPGADRIVGVMINNLPLRATVAPDEEIVGWLRSLQAQALDVQQHAFTPLTRVQEWSGVPWGRRLFDTFVVFQHASADAETASWLGPDVTIDPLHAPTRTAYPVSLVVAGTDVLSLRMTYDARFFDSQSAARTLANVRELLVAMPDGRRLVGELAAVLPAAERGAGVVVRQRTRSRDTFVAPRSATEAVLAEIWRELLGLEEVGVHDNFLALGGQSLLAMQVVSRIRDRFALDVPVRALFRGPTVAQLAQALTALERKPGQVERIAQLVQRVAGMSLEELRLAAASNQTRKDRTDAR